MRRFIMIGCRGQGAGQIISTCVCPALMRNSRAAMQFEDKRHSKTRGHPLCLPTHAGKLQVEERGGREGGERRKGFKLVS